MHPSSMWRTRKRPFVRAMSLLTGACILLAPVTGGAQGRQEFRGETQHREDRRQDRRDDRRDEFRDGRHRDNRGEWRFEPRRGWHYQRGPGDWSPFYVWWWLNGRATLGLPPAQMYMAYPTGQYELRGDGFRVPYYWVWIPAVPVAPPAPPPGYGVPPSAMLPPPPSPREARPVGSPSDRGTTGMVIGGIAGAVLGSTVGHGTGRTAGIIVGTLLGAIVGQEVGRSLDEADELRAAHVLEKNKVGQSSTWVNPDTGAEVSMVPERTYQDNSGEYCREYQTEVTVGGETRKGYGTACRQPDGQWKIVR